ncbi:LysM peptidoglycan-binding domain-containing protein [Frateuria terrea]|uniref:Phosphate transport system substrate-binding protein n=1 Tax=Frateuria terrea TaxID=529704 RepID=A0A1H6ZVR2_9GAMM|nr:substrate-binding domain-containing protein [Frateuria terrea]SEJ57573.1 phosphate transport system substrate-binding protein [Frateuria terrea]SFP65907.1 phosphate transport system substrate-binding protein [Frateuria terrea]
MPVRSVRLFVVALLGACLTSVAFAAGPTLVLRGDVATTRGMMEEVAKAWARSGHGKIDLQPFNTASGLDALRSGSADIAGSARPGNGSAAEAGLNFTPVAWDALVMVTHPSNPVSSLTLKQLHDIYYGKITNWNQVGGRDEPIDVYAVASPGDGVEFSLRKLLFGRGNQPVAAPRLYVNTAKLEEAVTLDPKALGATTLSRVAGNGKVKMIRIDGVAPSAGTVASGSYKLYAPLYLVTNPSSPHAAEAQAFVDFATSDKVTAALRSHSAVPYAAGAALASMDTSRRAQILAAVGAHAVPQPTPSAPPLAAPGATYASRAAIAPTSERTAEARRALEERRAKAAEVAAAKASLKGVKGEATTVDAAGARAPAFAKVTASATVKSTAAKAKSAAAHARTYKVAKGDTLFSIARAHAVDVADLRSWNHLKGNAVKTGQVLRVAER